uniref:SUN domain-containing protein n=1 Tax=Echeneis naucrates TaxID=173247 RepID=A0A665UYM0_ECHNA
MSPGLIYMHVQLKETQMEVHALRQRIDLFVSQTDTIPNFALESLGNLTTVICVVMAIHGLYEETCSFLTDCFPFIASAGAKVCHSLSSDTYWPYDIRLWERIFHRSHSSKKQRQVIQVGACWCFSGTSGHLLISLSHLVSITHVTLGHITKGRSPSGCIMSAPKEFSVFVSCFLLFLWTFSQNGPEFQTFKLLVIFFYVKLQVENNWGNTNYTCLYSFRVHGHLPL